MRIAPGFVSLALIAAAVAACGGGAPRPQPIGNTIAPPKAEPWTFGRVLASVPADASALLFVDVGKIKTSELAGPYIAMAEDAARATMKIECHLEFSGSLLLVGRVHPHPPVVWGFDVPTEALRTCLHDNPRDEIEIVGDDIHITTANGRAGIVRILDGETVVAAFGDSVDAATLDDAVARQDEPASFPEVKALRQSGATVWGVGHATAPPFALSPIKFRSGTLTATVTDRVAIDVALHLVEADKAAMLASTVKQQGQTLVTMGMVTALDTRADGDALSIHAEADKKALDSMVSMAKMLAASRSNPNPIAPPPRPRAP